MTENRLMFAEENHFVCFYLSGGAAPSKHLDDEKDVQRAIMSQFYLHDKGI